MFVFGLHSTSDDQLSDPSKKCQPKGIKKKGPLSYRKVKCSFLDLFNFWWLVEQKMSTETQKNKKGPLSHQKIKCLFLDNAQILMTGQAIWAKNVNWNAKKWKRPSKSSKNKMFVFGLRSTSDDRLSDLNKKHQPKYKKLKKAPQVIEK